MAALQIAAPTAFPEAIEGAFTGVERGLGVLAVAPVTTILAAPPAPRNQEFDGAVNAIWRIVVTTLVVLAL